MPQRLLYTLCGPCARCRSDMRQEAARLTALPCMWYVHHPLLYSLGSAWSDTAPPNDGTAKDKVHLLLRLKDRICMRL